MTQFEFMTDLLDKNKVTYRITAIYDENNNRNKAIWLEVGHIEFDEYDNIKNIVNW